MNNLKTAATFSALLLAVSFTAVASEEGEAGRYQGIEASDSAVWVVDTRTGRVRKCTQEFADAQPVCSVFSQ